jgi:hypothetical protein
MSRIVNGVLSSNRITWTMGKITSFTLHESKQNYSRLRHGFWTTEKIEMGCWNLPEFG